MDGRDDIDGLVAPCLALVHHIVRQVSARFPRHVDREELRGAGAAGLVDAARRYDPASGVPFSRYAAIRIRGEIIDAVRRRDWGTRRLRRDLRTIDAVAAELAEHLQRTPTDGEIAAHMDVPADAVRQLRAAHLTATLLTLDRAAGTGAEDRDSLLDAIAEDDAAWLPEPATERNELVGTLRRAIDALPPDLRTVLVAHQFDERSMREIAQEMGRTEARVSQLRHEALCAVQAYFATQFDGVPEVPDEAPGKRRREIYVAQMCSRLVSGQGDGRPRS